MNVPIELLLAGRDAPPDVKQRLRASLSAADCSAIAQESGLDVTGDLIVDVSLSDDELMDVAGGGGAGTAHTELQWAGNRRGLPPSMREPR